jgi:predicted DNA-binding protein (MmcQ/YjbR family)
VDRASVRDFCLGLKGATLDHPFGDHHDAYRIGGKMFAMVGETGGISFKV